MRTWFGILSVFSVFLCLAGYLFAADPSQMHQPQRSHRRKERQRIRTIQRL